MTAYRSRPMPGRARVSLEQLYQADQEMFKWMARVCINGIQPEIDVRPFETALKRVLKGRIQDITSLHNSFQMAGGASAMQSDFSRPTADEYHERLEAPVSKRQRDEPQDHSGASQREAKLMRRVEQMQNENNNLKKKTTGKGQQQYQPKLVRGWDEQGGKGKGGQNGRKGEGKWNKWVKTDSREQTKWKGDGMVMPPGLVGGMSTFENKRLCFNYNLGKCTACRPGQECSRGYHLCCVQGCGSFRHCYQTHDVRQRR